MSTEALKKASTTKLIVALVLSIVSGGVSNAVSPTIGGLVSLIALVLWCWGLSELAQSKGYSKWLGALGIVGCIGWIILAILPNNANPGGMSGAGPNSNYPR